MKTALIDGDPGDWPPHIKKKEMGVEPTPDGFWCYSATHRSAGRLPETPFHETLFWLVEQIAIGNFAASQDEEGVEVTVTIGKAAAYPATSERQAAEGAGAQILALSVAGYIAEAREKGFHPKLQELHRRVWEEGTPSAFRRMEMHYALELARLLGRISKKLPVLEQLPILGNAPEATRAHIAEATRCYLLKLDRACIALCRSCLEDTLKRPLTQAMKNDWHKLIDDNRQRSGSPNQMHALIEVCAQHGVLKNLTNSAHDVREAGNAILHVARPANDQEDLAGKVLKKTRAIVALIYGATTPQSSSPQEP